MDEEELEAQKQERMQKRLRAMQLEEQRRSVLKQALSPDAYERMGNVKVSSPELYERVAQTLAYLYSNGQMSGRISDEKLLTLLEKLTERKETKIEFKRK